MSRLTIALLAIVAAVAGCASGHPSSRSQAASASSHAASAQAGTAPAQANTAPASSQAAPAQAGTASASSHAAPASSHAAPAQPGTALAPPWCTPAFDAAVGGRTPAALEPYRKDSPTINDLFRQWSFVLAANKMISHPRSIAWLWKNAPVTTSGLQATSNDISEIKRLCSG